MVYYESNYLCHHGILGQKWGQRRWQNSDGTFNAAGKARYFKNGAGDNYHKIGKNKSSGVSGVFSNKKAKESQTKKAPEAKAKRVDNLKKAAKIGASVAAAGLLAYGGYKLYSSNQANKAIKSMISDEQARERRAKGEQALARMYDKMAVDAMKNGASHYSFTDNRIGYHIEMGKK